MSKTWKLIAGVLISFAFVAVVGVVGAKAADTTIDGKLTVKNDLIAEYPIYAHGNHIIFKGDANMDINMDYGDSQRRIKSESDGMRIYTYSDLHLDNGGMVYVHNASSFGGVADFTGGVTGTTGTLSGALSADTGTFASGLLGHTAATAPTTALGEGAMYYDTAADLMYMNTGTAAAPTWTALGTATAFTLDAAYNQSGGASTVLVDNGDMTWDLTGTSDFIIDAGAATSNIVFQAAGTDVWSWDLQGLLDVASLTGIAGDLIDITRSNTATGGDMLDIDMGTAAIAGDAIDIAFGAGVSTGDAIVVDMGATNLAGGALVVTAAGGVRTDAIIDVTTASTGAANVAEFTTTAALTGNVIDINVGTAIATGNAVDVTFADVAQTGHAFAANMGTNLAGNALFIDLAGLRTGAAILIDDDSTRTAPAIDINIDTVAAGNAIDITYATVASAETAIDLNMGTNVAGDAIDINTAATTGQAMQIDATGVFTNQLIDINTTAAFTGNILDITSGTAASSGNFIDLNFGNIADTGDAINITMGAADVGAQALVISTAAGVQTAATSPVVFDYDNTTGTSAFMDVDIAGARGGFMDIDVASTLGTENLIDIDMADIFTSDVISLDAGDVAHTGDWISVATGNGNADGDVLDVTIETNAISTQVFDINNVSASDEEGWLLDIDTGAAWAADMIHFNSTAGIWTADIFGIVSGGDGATGDIFDVNIEANDTGIQYLKVVNDAASAQAGWFFDLDVGGITGGVAMYIDDDASIANGAIDFDYDSLTTGNMVRLQDTGTARTSGHVLAIDDANDGTGASTGSTVHITQTAAMDQAAIEIDSAATTGDILDIDGTAGTTGDALDITYTGTSGAGIRVTDSTANDANSMISLNNTDATVIAQTYLIDGIYADNDEDLADFLKFTDASGDQFTIASDGTTVIAGAAEGTAALTVTAGDLMLTAGDLDVNGNNIDGDGNLIIDGATGLDLTASANALDLLATNAMTITATDGSIGITTSGGAADDITLTSGDDIDLVLTTADDSINIGIANQVHNINIGSNAGPANVIKIGGALSSTTLYGTVTAPKAINYVTTTAVAGADHAITLDDAAGVDVPLAAGLTIMAKFTSATVGADTITLNAAGGAKDLDKASAPATAVGADNPIAAGYAIIVYDGTQWLSIGQ